MGSFRYIKSNLNNMIYIVAFLMLINILLFAQSRGFLQDGDPTTASPQFRLVVSSTLVNIFLIRMWVGTITKAIACFFLLNNYGVLSFAVDSSISNNYADYPVEYSPIYDYESKFSRPKRGILKIRRINKIEGGDNSPLVRGMFEEEYQDGGHTKKSKVFYKSESGYSSDSFNSGMEEFNNRFPDEGFDDNSFFTENTDNNRRISRPEDNFNMGFIKGPFNSFMPSNLMPNVQRFPRPNYQQQQYIFPYFG